MTWRHGGGGWPGAGRPSADGRSRAGTLPSLLDLPLPGVWVPAAPGGVWPLGWGAVTDDNAAIALGFAVQLAPDVVTSAEAPDVVKVARLLWEFLEHPADAARLVVIAEIDGAAVPITHPGGTMAQVVNATVDNNTVTLTVLSEDDHNNPTSDTLTITNDDTAAVVADWVLSADTHTYTGTLKHVEGTVNISITDPAAPALAATDVQLVVGPGATSQVNVTAAVA